MSPTSSDDLSELIDRQGTEFIAWRSADGAEHDPQYERLGSYSSLAEAQAALRQS